MIRCMKNAVELRLPFAGKWFVEWGGDTKKLNYHRVAPAQKGAFDFVVHDETGKSHKGRGTKNEDYYAFGQAVFAPAHGIVIEAVEGVRDNKPGQTNLFAVGGNYLLIQHSTKEYSFIAHLQQGSTLVRSGERVRAGQKLGKCGNSGNSSEPHIHYHLQDSDVHSEFAEQKPKPIAQGIKVYFSNILVERQGRTRLSAKCSPIKEDVVSPI